MEQKFNLTAHKKLWNWLADNPGMHKEDYFDTMGIDEDYRPINLCYACEYTERCVSCPLYAWGSYGGDTCVGFYGSGKYQCWEDAMRCHDYKKACNIARQIANLPVKEGVETI